jgi:hypothetical protein
MASTEKSKTSTPMKTKFLFAALAATLAIGALAPTVASAHDSGCYVTRVVGYDSCGRPVYRQVWMPSQHSHGYSHSSGHSHSSHGSSHSGHYRGSSHGGRSHGGISIQVPGLQFQFGGNRGHSHGHSHGR